MRLVLVAATTVACVGLNALADEANVNPQPLFERDVVAILKAYCWKCHGGEGLQAGLDLRTLPLMLAGGKSGPAVVRGSAEQSRLYQKIVKQQMPPGGELKPTDQHLATLKRWLDAGAPALYEGGPITEAQSPQLKAEDHQWWAFRTPTRPTKPRVLAKNRVRNAIDAFVLQKLEAKGLSFSGDADPLTLLRRVYLDVIGLPPSPKQAKAFLSDRSNEAYEKLVDSLLVSRHYGERWGRHWLDAAGYVDTIGSDNDAKTINGREGIWRYRDYVIESLNNDVPYDRFLQEQLAGDELVDWRNAKMFTPEMRRLLVATGFLRQAADVTYAPELNTSDIRHQVLHDTARIVASNVLGLTVHCAQCHSHKFDPISHLDYYRFLAIFKPAYEPLHWKHSKDRFLYDVPASKKREIDTQNAKINGQINAANGEIAAIQRVFERQLVRTRWAKVPGRLRDDTNKALATPAGKRNDVQKYLAQKVAPLLRGDLKNSAAVYNDVQAATKTPGNKRNAVQKYLVERIGPLLTIPPGDVEKALDEAARTKIANLRQRIASLGRQRRSYGKVQALWEFGPPLPSYLYRRGDYQSPGAAVTPGVPAVLGSTTLPRPKPGSPSSGYRTALARWLTQPDHPLTGRVIVNRIWQQYFGRGIVATPDNFGRSGARPTHPELLDWLAVELVEGGWKLKRLHRLILTSTTYRQASWRESLPQIDPGNTLLWRQRLRRLESEIIRDAVLTVSGKLDRTSGGPPVPLKPNPDGSVEIDTGNLARPTDRFRRSVYVFARRNYQLTELGVFDQPVVSHNCTRRTSSAVVLQPLAMLNGKSLLEQAEHFATRVRGMAGADDAKRIETAFRLALVRKPIAAEVALSRGLIAKQTARYQQQMKLPATKAADAALTHLCHMLLNTNEFLYVE